jgi:prophage regulatory protein
MVAKNSRRVLRLPKVVDKVALERSCIYRLIAAGDFPAPTKLTARASGWFEDEIDAWLEKRATARLSQSSPIAAR